MTPERWRQVKCALSEAMALNGAARAAYLERLGAEDPELRAELDSLLAAEQEAGSRFLETPAPAALGAVGLDEEQDVHDQLVGRRLGAYRLLAQIGSGGMGQVYRAVRADDEYQQEVAVKLVRAGADPGFVTQRLRTERQILASLVHPNIARLLDGGTTPEGVPYLVMELIDGEPITRYCERRQLDVTARLELFLLVCSAVQYAHQRMVIHRDLKPGNILVTAGGTPKLLDFGIAKILEPGAIPVHADATVATLRILTPDYASPEQIRGETVTAASDVYSLGLVLYELLTGTQPFHGIEPVTVGTLATARDVEPRKPSTVASPTAEGSPERLRRRLRGDLDNIVLMALRREPDRRYGTVEGFANDIRKHLEHLPVTARKPTLGYRVGTFVARHRIAVATTALFAVALCSGLIMTLHEAHVADAQRARADRRFDDVRRLADTLIFGVHDSIRDLPGAGKARRLVIDTAVQYLDSLSRDAANDPSLQHELAIAYLRLGDLQGQAREANQGDYAGALRSYRRAFTLLEASLAAAPADAAAQRDMIMTCGKLSDLLWSQNDAAGALWYSRQTVARSARLAARAPADRRARYFVAASLLDHGYKLFMIRGDTVAALRAMRRSVAVLESLHAAAPADPLPARTLALGYGRMAEALESRDDYTAALSTYRKGLRLLQTLLGAAPRNTDLRHLLAFAQLNIAEVLTELGRLDEAAQSAQTALASFESLTASDPKIAEYRHDIGRALASLARIAGLRGQPERSIALLQQALAQMDAAARGSARDSNFEIGRARMELLAGDEYAALAADTRRSESRRSQDWRKSCREYESALTRYRRLSGAWAAAVTGAAEAQKKIRGCDAALAAIPHGLD